MDTRFVLNVHNLRHCETGKFSLIIAIKQLNDYNETITTERRALVLMSSFDFHMFLLQNVDMLKSKRNAHEQVLQQNIFYDFQLSCRDRNSYSTP